MKTELSLGLLAVAIAAATPASAQWATPLASKSVDELRPLIQQHYDEALKLSRTPEVIAADNARFIAATDAKAHCGIAIGYLKAGIRDTEALARCDAAYQLMQQQPVAVAELPAPPPPPATCDISLPLLVFFDWNSSTPGADAQPIIAGAAKGVSACGWSHLVVSGYTDTSGTDAYNMGLSQRRADAVSQLLQAAGVPAGVITARALGETNPKVATADGVREPQNRRVEITADAAH